MTLSTFAQGYAQRHLRRNHQTLKTFSDTYANSGTAATQTLDAASPFGATRLRVDAPEGNTYTEVALNAGFSIANWLDGETIGFRLWLDDWRNISQVQVFAGVTVTGTPYTRLIQNTINVQNSNTNNRNGPITFPLNSHITTANTFVFGTDALDCIKIRVFTRAGRACRFWVDRFEIAPRSRPKAIITFDDASASWIDNARSILNAAGIRATFGVNTGDVGTNDTLYVTAAELRTLQSDGHQIQAHNVTNTAYNGANLAAYVAEYDSAVRTLKSYGITGEFMYHPFVQGAYDQSLIGALGSRGVRVFRGVDSNSATTCRLNQPACGGVTDGLSDLKVASHGASLSLANSLTNLSNLLKYGGTLVSMFHDLTTGVASGVQWTASDFQSYINQLVAYRNQGLLDTPNIAQWERGLTVPTMAAA